MAIDLGRDKNFNKCPHDIFQLFNFLNLFRLDLDDHNLIYKIKRLYIYTSHILIYVGENWYSFFVDIIFHNK